MATTSAPASPQARLTIKEAFERLKQSVTPDDARRFQATTLQDVHDAAIVVEDKIAASGSLRNLRRIEPFLTGLGRYAKVIEVMCNGTDYLPWIWAPIKLMLQLASDYSSSLQKLLDSYAQICDTLPRFDRLSVAFKNNVHFQKVLAMFYADILEFHRQAYKFFTQRVWRRLFDTSWTGFDRRFKGILDNLSRNAELVEKEATAADITEAKEWRDNQKLNIALFEKERLSSQVASVLSWLELSECPRQDDELDRLLGHYHCGTCDWILDHAAFRKWTDGRTSQNVLWLHGKPGAGKSMLCSYVIQKLQETHQSVLYFFCSYRSSRDCVHVLRSITAQILRMNPDLAAYICEKFSRQALTPSICNLRKLLSDLISSLQSPIIVLDGIDESPLEEQRTIIREIMSLFKGSSQNSGLKALFSSRDVPTLSKSLSKTASICLSDEHLSVNLAIEIFVDRKLNELRDNLDEVQFDESLASSMKRKIVERANGMFLWVYLVIVSLENVYNIRDLQAVVETLPRGLSEIYSRILYDLKQRHEAHNFERALRILEWVTYSQRPLRKVEILDGVALHRGNTVLSMSTKLFEQVLDTCKPLIESGSNGTVVLVHFSLKEYLQMTDTPIAISPQTAHFDMTLACVALMERALDLLDTSLPVVSSIVDAGNGLFNLLPYAHKYWFEHLLCFASISRALSREDASVTQLLDLLLALSVKHKRLLQIRQIAGLHNAYTQAAVVTKDVRLRDISSDAEFYPLVSNTVYFRKLVNAEDFRNGSELQEFELDKDPTLLSHLIYTYEDIIQMLLSADEVSGLSKATLSAFKRTHLSTAFKCRFGGCYQSSQGFEMAEKRDHHERITHMRRIPCPHAECPYSSLGFTATNAMRKHLNDYHIVPERPTIPQSIRRRETEASSQRPRIYEWGNSGVSSMQGNQSLDTSTIDEYPSPKPKGYLPLNAISAEYPSIHKANDKVNFFDVDSTTSNTDASRLSHDSELPAFNFFDDDGFTKGPLLDDQTTVTSMSPASNAADIFSPGTNFFDKDCVPPAYLDKSANISPSPFFEGNDNILYTPQSQAQQIPVWPPMTEKDSRTSASNMFGQDVRLQLPRLPSPLPRRDGIRKKNAHDANSNDIESLKRRKTLTESTMGSAPR